MEPESLTDFLKRIKEEKRKGTKTGYAEFEGPVFASTRAETATRTAQFRSFEEFLKATAAEAFANAAEFAYWTGIDLGSNKPDISAKKREKIKKLEAFMNDSAATSGEKENAKRLIEKIKAGA